MATPLPAHNGFFRRAGNSLETSWNDAPLSAAQIGLWVFLASISMLFAGFISAIFVRRTSLDWQPIAAPALLWFNTAVLLVSSAAIERTKTLVRGASWRTARTWLLLTTALGILFLAGQIAAWQELVARGIFLSGSPHSSFFYILTGAHAVHLIGGLAALLWLLARVRRTDRMAASQPALNLCATYWHFLDGLWIFLFVVLFL